MSNSKIKNEDNEHNETDSDRLRGITNINALSVSMVSAFAKDRPMRKSEEIFISDMQKTRGKYFFSDLLYAVTHQYFPVEVSEKIWDNIIKHKHEMSKALNRNVQIVVATLDYLTNLQDTLVLPTLVNEAHISSIVSMSMRDGLTGLFNHTSCHEIIDLELRSYIRHKTTISIIILDLDDFKGVNDNYGHKEGDRVLTELSDLLENETRSADICCRYGGEEFIVILPLTEIDEALEIAERLRKQIMRIRVDGRAITASLGVSSCDENTVTPHDLIKKADKALYQAKNKGKNKVVVI